MPPLTSVKKLIPLQVRERVKKTLIAQGLFGDARSLKAKLDRARLGALELQGLLEESRKQTDAFTSSLVHGEDFRAAAVQETRRLLRLKKRVPARAFAHALYGNEASKEAGALCTAIHAARDGSMELAYKCFSESNPDLCLKVAPQEFTTSWMAVDAASAVKFFRRLFDERFEQIPLSTWFEIIKSLVGRKELEFANAICARLELDSRSGADIPPEDLRRLRWTAAHLARWKSAQEAPRTSAQKPTIAVTDYKNADYDATSANLGDYTQTLSFLSNLVRFENVNFDDGSELGRFVNGLKERIAPEKRISTPAIDANLAIVDRDLSSARLNADPTWLFAFGWFMHPSFQKFYDFPFAKGIAPIFISFHVNRREMLTPEAVAYLKEHGPVGCRDWTTVYILRDYGIEAFFSGCMTSTVGQLYPANTGSKSRTNGADTLALVDYKPKPDEFVGVPAVEIQQVSLDVREGAMLPNLQGSLALLEGYRSHQRIVTSRLHTYFPSRSLGLNVDFRPKNPADVRFEGLWPLDDAGFNKIRTGIETKVAEILRLIFNGTPRDQIYSAWREMCRPDVEAANQHCQKHEPLAPPSFSVSNAVQQMRAASYIVRPEVARADGAVEVAFAVDLNLSPYLPAVIESVLANTKRPVMFTVMTRDLTKEFGEKLAAAFPNAGFRFFACDSVDYGTRLRMLAHTSVSTMDRLLLPALLEDLDKIVYLDVDLIVEGDVGELFDTDMSKGAVAGRTSIFPTWRFGWQMVYRAASTLSREEAWNLRRLAHASGDLSFPAFNAGVLVLNLKKMREDDFCRRFIPFIERCAMNDQDALNLYAGWSRVQLASEWNVVPTQDVAVNPKIIHWAGPVKPWGQLQILFKDRFAKYAAAAAARMR